MMTVKSPARILRDVKRITNYMMKKNAQNRLSITRLDEIDIPPVPTEPNLQNQLDFKTGEMNVQQVRMSEMENNFYRSEFLPYCPECDHTYKREQVLIFREHCRRMHNWLWCRNWDKGEGCEFATTVYAELQEHLDSCNIKPLL